MRIAAFLIPAMLLLTCCAHAQRTRYGSIKGTVVDSLSRHPLEAATVTVYLLSDSSMVNYSLTSRRGEFSITGVPLAALCRLTVTYNGLRTHIQEWTIPADKKEWLLDTIALGKEYAELGEVTVVAQRPPVVIKKDTVEFNAAAYRTAPNAVVEDIVKQLPGVEIDKEGNITLNGKKISKITINGKEFFGGDPKVALKNLPTDLLDKIQVTDNKTREAMFNKTSDGNEDKSINLTLKRDKNQGWFGRFTGGYGTDKRYETGASLNLFSDKQQISFIGTANNTNRMNFSSGEFSMSNARSSLGGGGGGINESKAAGINFSNELSKKVRVNGSYFYNNSHNTNVTRTERENILQDSTFLYRSLTNNVNDNDGHRGAINVDWTPDSLSNFHLNAAIYTSASSFAMHNEALSERDAHALINTSKNDYYGTDRSTNGSVEFFAGRKLDQRGRSVTLGVNYNATGQKGNNTNIGETVFYENATPDSTLINQQSYLTNNNSNVALSATYTEPLSSYTYLMFRYNYRTSYGNADKITNSFNATTGKYDQPDTAFSNAFKNSSNANSPGLTINHTKNKWRASAGFALEWLRQSNEIVSTHTLLDQQFLNVFPSASIAYQFSKTSNLNIFYNGHSQQPSLQQLQPVPDNSNPLYVRLGNPGLRPSFYHNININTQSSDGKTYWYGGANINLVRNQVVDATRFEASGRQVARPVNVNGNYGMSGNFNYSRSWKKKIVSFRANIGGGANLYRNTGFIQDTINIAKGMGLWQQVGFNFTYKELLTVMPTFNVRYNKTRYSSRSLPSATFTTKSVGADVFWNWPKRLILENSVRYNYNSNIAPGFRKGVTMWNAAINYQLFKNKEGLLRLAVYDLLRQNISVYRNITQTYIEDTQVQVLQQYALLSFTYNLRKFSGGRTK